MAFLSITELTTSFYKDAATMPEDVVFKKLAEANSYAFGYIGGVPPVLYGDDGTNLKIAVALAFEIMVKGETSQVDTLTGNITDIAPVGAYAYYQAKKEDPFATVMIMLDPYKKAFDAANVSKSSRGVMFL